jgi:hypothetical protein
MLRKQLFRSCRSQEIGCSGCRLEIYEHSSRRRCQTKLHEGSTSDACAQKAGRAAGIGAYGTALRQEHVRCFLFAACDSRAGLEFGLVQGAMRDKRPRS